MSAPASHTPTRDAAADDLVAPLLDVRDLAVTYGRGPSAVRAAREISLRVARGEILGLVGESGSGKSTVLTALMRMLPRRQAEVEGEVRLDGTDLVGLSERQLRQVRGRQIGLVPQRPMTSLSPVTPVGVQLRRLTGGEVSDERLHELLTSVGLGGLRGRLRDYPFQFSGGQLQRMLIAVAVLAREPALVLADEPTTTLDATVQAQILHLLLDLRERLGNSVVFVSHDLGVVANVCDRVAVMYAGLLIEVADTATLFSRPRHPYTRALLEAMPGRRRPGERLTAIEGTVTGAHRLAGCPFAPRCPRAEARCRAELPALREVDGRQVRCHFAEEFNPAEEFDSFEEVTS